MIPHERAKDLCVVVSIYLAKDRRQSECRADCPLAEFQAEPKKGKKSIEQSKVGKIQKEKQGEDEPAGPRPREQTKSASAQGGEGFHRTSQVCLTGELG